MSTLFRQQAVGAGNGAEQIVGTNGSIVIPDGQKLQITDLLGTYQGAGIQRIREDDLVGAEITRVRYAADGTIIAGLGSPVEIVASGGPKTIVITEEGAFANTLTVVGVMEPVNA